MGAYDHWYEFEYAFDEEITLAYYGAGYFLGENFQFVSNYTEDSDIDLMPK
jgi:hypothetical protein